MKKIESPDSMVAAISGYQHTILSPDKVRILNFTPINKDMLLKTVIQDTVSLKKTPLHRIGGRVQ